jgi:hypothetical protein
VIPVRFQDQPISPILALDQAGAGERIGANDCRADDD